MAERLVKGVHLKNVAEFVRKKRGAAGLKELLEGYNAKKPKGARLDFSKIDEREMYSYDAYLDLLKMADKVVGRGDLSRIEEMGSHTVQHLGHLSYLARAPNIHDFIEGAAKNWRSVYSFGELEYVKEGTRKVVLRYHDFPQERAKCMYFKGSIEGMLALCRLKGTVTETACNTKGKEYCEYTIEWV
ncbi:MAG: DUF2378 family protein [Euryarchaeota archaeon]|nr:DUF2378 family protein [Euryarchaeota archaeon]